MAWSRTQGLTAISGANPSSLTITLGGVDHSGQRLVLAVSFNGTGTVRTISSVSDGTNTWNADRAGITGGNDGGYLTRLEHYSAPVASATTPAVAVTLSSALAGGDGIACSLEEYDGLDTTSGAAAGVDVSQAAGGLGTASSGNTGNTTAANELVHGAYGDDGSTSTVFGTSGLTTRLETHTGIAGLNVGDKDSSTSGTAQSAAWSSVPVVSTGCIVVVYKLAAAGGGTSLSPSAASLILTGLTAVLGLALSPTTASLLLTGIAPSVVLGTVVTPTVGTLTTTGSVARLDLSIPVSVATLVINGQTPTANVGVNVQPIAATLTLSGATSTVTATQNVSLSPAPATLVTTTAIARLDMSIPVAPRALVTTTIAPSVTATANVSVAPAPAALITTTIAPAVTVTGLLTPAFVSYTAVAVNTAISAVAPFGSAQLSVVPVTQARYAVALAVNA